MADKSLSVVLSLRDEFSKRMELATDALNSFGTISKRTNNSISLFSKEVRQAIKPFTELRTIFMRVAGVAASGTAAFYTYKKAIEDVSVKISELDRLSIKLGVSSEELSIKLYGQNYTTANNRIASAWLAKTSQVAGNTLGWWQGVLSNLTGGAVKASKQQEIFNELWSAQSKRLGRLTTKEQSLDLWKRAGFMADAQLIGEGQRVKERNLYKRNPALIEEVQTKTDTASLSSYQLKKKQFQQEISLYREAGIEENRLTAYQAAYEKRINQERSVDLLKLHAQELQAKGQTITAQRLLDMAALADFQKKYGGDGEMVAAYKAGQAATRQERERQRNNEIAGLKAQTLQAQGDSLAALKIQHKQELEEIERTYGSNSEAVRIVKEGQEAMEKLATGLGQAMLQIGNSMTSSLGDVFADITTGFSNLKSIAQDFGNSIINTLAQAASRAMLFNTIGRATSSFFGYNIFGSFHQGGVVKAHSGYLASDEIPIIAQAGEGIISRKGMAALGAGNLQRLNQGQGPGESPGVVININPVIQAWDASDIQRNQEQITAVIGRAISSNSDIRRIIKAYT